MTTSYGPQIVQDGLILHLDVTNLKSVAMNTLINWNTWLAGTGAVSGYACNGDATESLRSLQTDPFGNSNMVWGTTPAGDNAASGGFYTSYYAIDNTKLYRHSVWIRRISDTTLGNSYMGLWTNGGGPLQISNGAANTNSYWDCRNIGWFTKNTWYLIVGHIYPYDTTATDAHPETGIYTIAGGTTKVATCGCNIGGKDLKFKSTDTTMANRCYHYYCTDTTSKIEFFQPRIDCCDGTEPTITELLAGAGSYIYDLSGYSNHHVIVKNPVFNSTAGYPKSFTLDGSTQGFYKGSSLTGVSTSCTVQIFYKTTDITELWVGGDTNGYYLSASSNNAYYHGSCGSPSNYIDLVDRTRGNPYALGYKDGNYHFWEAKNVNFSSWNLFQWFLYTGGWQLLGTVSNIIVYNRSLTSDESAKNYRVLKGKFGL